MAYFQLICCQFRVVAFVARSDGKTARAEAYGSEYLCVPGCHDGQL